MARRAIGCIRGSDREIIRIQAVLPFFSEAELTGLAGFLEQQLALRLERLPRRRGPGRDPHRQTRPPSRAAD